jgi:hypothetical protein
MRACNIAMGLRDLVDLFLLAYTLPWLPHSLVLGETDVGGERFPICIKKPWHTSAKMQFASYEVTGGSFSFGTLDSEF